MEVSSYMIHTAETGRTCIVRMSSSSNRIKLWVRRDRDEKVNRGKKSE